MLKEHCRFTFAVFYPLFATGTYGEIKRFVKPHVDIRRSKYRRNLGNVLLEKNVEIFVRRTAARAAGGRGKSPAFFPFVFAFAEIFELRVCKKLLQMTEVFEYGNKRNALVVAVFYEFAHFVKRISIVFVKILRFVRTHGVFKITKHCVVTVFSRKVYITLNKRQVFLLSRQINLRANQFHFILSYNFFETITDGLVSVRPYKEQSERVGSVKVFKSLPCRRKFR